MLPLKYIMLTLSITVASIGCKAQIIDPDTYKWDSIPAKMAIENRFSNASAVILKDLRLYHYYYDKKKQKSDLSLEEIRYRTIQINDTRAIEYYNKLYIPISGVLEVVEIHARTISPTGQVVELNKDKIRELDNKEGEGAYKIYAFEGLEKGGRLEYFYKLRKEPEYTLRTTIQSTDPVQMHQVEIITPDNLKFDHKTYNGMANEIDTVIDEKRFMLLTAKDILGKDEEKYSNYSAELMRHEFQLAYNSAVGKGRVLSYNTAVERTYPVYFTPDPKAAKSLKKLSQQLGLSKLDQRQKIKHIENYVKENIQEVKSSTSDLFGIGKIIQNKLGNPTGITRLYIQLFRANGITCQLVYTTDRTKVPFDADFESWNYLSEILIYFPALDEYLDPSDVKYRFPFIPVTYTLNNGLFMEEISTGKVKSATAVVKQIKAQAHENNGEVIDAYCKLTADMDSVDVKFTHSYKGVMSSLYRYVFNVVQQEDKKKQLDLMMKFFMPDSRIVRAEIKNTDYLDSEKPIETVGEVVGASLIERTGKDVIFKIGDLLGPQTELYQEKERQSDIDVEYAHSLIRIIRLEVPKGYKLSGLDAIKMNLHYNYGGKDAYGFISDYTLAGDVLTIHINEYYYVVRLPKSEFSNFRKVINASADFNKVNVVLEKL